jgi:hypothetical protein
MKNNLISSIIIASSIFLVVIMISGIAFNAIAQLNATNGPQNMTGITENNGGVPDPTLGSGEVGREGAAIGAMGSEATPSRNNAGSESEASRGNTGGIGGGLGAGNDSGLGTGS